MSAKGTYDYNEKTELWRWRGYQKDPVSGKNKQKALYSKSKKDLREKVEIYLANLEGGEAGKDITLNAWAKTWLNDIIGDSVKIRTIETYEYVINSHILPYFGNQKIGKLNAMSLQEHLNTLHKKYSTSTVTKIRRYLIMILDCAVRYGYISLNPARQTRPPRSERKDITALSREQTEAIIEAAKKGEYQEHAKSDKGAEYLRRCYYVLITVAIDTGMREGELFGLKWEDVSESCIIVRNNLIYTAKGGRKLDTPKTKTSARKIILTERSIKLLLDWKKYQRNFATEFVGFFNNKNKMVFTTSTGTFADVHNFMRRCWRPICNQLKLKDITFHSLRHAHASQLLAAGISPQIVMQRLGHSSLDVTLKIYAHLLPNMQEMAMDKINKIFS